MNWKIWLSRSILIGILVSLLAGCASMSAGSPSTAGETQVVKQLSAQATQSPIVGGETSIASYASMPTPVLGVVIDQNGKVVFVEPGSAAEQAGVSVDDVLESVNEVAVNPDRGKVRKIIASTPEGQSIDLKLKHGDLPKTIKIKPAHPTSRTGMATPTPVFSPQDYL